MTPRGASLLRAAFALYAARAASAAIVSYPVARTLTAFGARTRPEGDASLFADGGLLLLDTLRVAEPALRGVAQAASVLTVALAVLGLLPLGFSLSTLRDGTRPWFESTRDAARWFPTLVLLGGATIFVQALLAAGGAFLAGGAMSLAGKLADERAPALAAAPVVLVTALLVAGAGIVQDLVRADVAASDDASLQASLRVALASARARPGRIFAAWGTLAALQGAVVLGAAVVTPWIDVSKPGAMRIVAVASLHQAAVFATCWIRCVWLSRALGFSSGVGG